MSYNNAQNALEDGLEQSKLIDLLLGGVVVYGSLDKALSAINIKEMIHFSKSDKELLLHLLSAVNTH